MRLANLLYRGGSITVCALLCMHVCTMLMCCCNELLNTLCFSFIRRGVGRPTGLSVCAGGEQN